MRTKSGSFSSIDQWIKSDFRHKIERGKQEVKVVQKPDINEFKDLPLEDLQEMQQRLSSFVQRRLEGKKREALNQIRELTVQYELTFDEVVAAIRTTTKRGKAPALYRNPDKPRQTWSGKGEAPDWFKNHPNPDSLKIPGA
jgi:DNA-binding protein H-NS